MLKYLMYYDAQLKVVTYTLFLPTRESLLIESLRGWTCPNVYSSNNAKASNWTKNHRDVWLTF